MPTTDSRRCRSSAVDEVLLRPGYRERAQHLRGRFREYRPFDAIAEIVEQA